MRGKILLLAHKREAELELVLNSIRNSDLTSIDSLLTVQQDLNPGVSKLLKEIDWIAHQNKNVARNPLFSVEQQINSNLYTGLELVFSDPKVDFVAVLEDDIVIAFDFFTFAMKLCTKYRNNSAFRGVNSISGVPREYGNENEYCLYRYGLAWGWTISREVWIKLITFWNGKENAHWDGLVEHYVKTGFVAMPILSKINNIGFGNSATHTMRKDSSQLHPDEKKLLESFKSTTNIQSEYRYVLKRLNWRSDCLPYLSTRNIRGKLVDSLYNLNWTLWKHTKGKYRSKGIALISKIIEQLCKIRIT
jgi:hypothetical protein